MKLIDHVGDRFGRLVVVEQSGRDKFKKVLWKCICDCGKVKVVSSGSLVTKTTTSCGCYHLERITRHGACINGEYKSSYNTWRAMMRRCFNPHDKDYPRYGAVGVIVCPEWKDYSKFVSDMGEPVGDETLDRKDPYGDYFKGNCRWASLPVQARNIRLRERSRTGVIGVSEPYAGAWIAKITLKKKAYYSKIFRTKEEATLARKELERLYWGAE